MKEVVKYHAFERIPSQMARIFGTIPKGREDDYNMILFPMESNLVKMNRIHGINNGRRAMEAILACLFIVDGYLNKKEYDLSNFISAENEAYINGLLMSFDPFTNEEIKSALESDYDLSSPKDLADYFCVPVRCLLRIAKSIDLWTKEFGVNGYFDFLEGQLGATIERNDKMDFTIHTRDSF